MTRDLPNRNYPFMASLLTGFVLLLAIIAQPAHALNGLPDFTTLVKKNHEAVVNISISQDPEQISGPQLPDGESGSPLDDLIRRYEQERGPQGGPESGSQGSGFIISADGFILTNNHVVEGADNVIVRLHDRRQLNAVVVGTDPRSDVAVLKIEAKDLPVVSIGNSDELEVGEWVLAIGSPFGFDFSVTAGIVSATGRALPNENYVPFIQTDVAINPGNSGGPLFNLSGDVIGINSQIYSRTGSFMGLSFAIPIELAMDVANQIRANGRVSRGWLGVIIQEVTLELAESFGMDRAYGALISQILPDSPASDSDLQIGDVITHFEGRRIVRSSALPPLVGRIPAESDAKLSVVRDGETVELMVNIGKLPTKDELRNAARSKLYSQTENPLKFTIKPLPDSVRDELGIDKGGVLVATVEEGGPAQQAGIRPDDAISMIDNKAVDSSSDVEQVLAELDGRKSVAVLVHRPEGPVFLALQMDD